MWHNTILSAVLYRCETWSLTLREEQRLRMFENGVVRLFGPTRDEVIGGWRKMHNEERHNLYSSPSSIKTKTNSVAWVRQRTIPTERRCLSAKLVPTFAARGCHAFSVTDPYGRILGFPGRSRYFFFQVAPPLYSQGWVDPIPDPLLRKSGSAGNRTRTVDL
jgi:hypothetical protein